MLFDAQKQSMAALHFAEAFDTSMFKDGKASSYERRKMETP